MNSQQKKDFIFKIWFKWIFIKSVQKMSANGFKKDRVLQRFQKSQCEG